MRNLKEMSWEQLRECWDIVWNYYLIFGGEDVKNQLDQISREQFSRMKQGQK